MTGDCGVVTDNLAFSSGGGVGALDSEGDEGADTPNAKI